MTNIEKEIAQKESKLVRLKAKAQNLDMVTGQKIVIKGMMLSVAKSNQ